MFAPPPRRTLDQSSIEATLRGAGVLEDATVLAALAAAVGYDPQRPRPAYDWSVHVVLEEIIPAVLGWTGTHDDHMYRLGRATFIGWGKTIVGRVLSAPLGQATPQRALQIMARLLSLNPQFGTHTLAERGPRDFQIGAEDDPRHPWFIAGLVIPAIEVAGGQDIRWSAQTTGPEAYTVDISWGTDGLPFQRVTI
jgi:uncharacterized protein (TIGR02265 family)